MPEFNIVCEWKVRHTFHGIEAATLKDAIEQAYSAEGKFATLPHGEYVDDTFEVDKKESEKIS